ncbi:Hypothetical protein FKW44_008123, partial [Caligus rogercresseyi]
PLDGDKEVAIRLGEQYKDGEDPFDMDEDSIVSGQEKESLASDGSSLQRIFQILAKENKL